MGAAKLAGKEPVNGWIALLLYLFISPGMWAYLQVSLNHLWVNHTLHAILTIFTCLLWGIVWAIIAATGGEKRQMVVVDEFGNVLWQKLGKA